MRGFGLLRHYQRMAISSDSTAEELQEARGALLLCVEELRSPRRWPKAKRDKAIALLLQQREQLKTLAAALFVELDLKRKP